MSEPAKSDKPKTPAQPELVMCVCGKEGWPGGRHNNAGEHWVTPSPPSEEPKGNDIDE